MPTPVCNTCSAEFPDEKSQKSHYRSDWHQYNLKRKLAGAPGVSEALFLRRLETLAAEKGRSDAENILYTCAVCHKEYRSSKAHAQHLRSKQHAQRALLWSKSSGPITVTKPVPCRFAGVPKAKSQVGCQFQLDGYSSDDWEEVNNDDDVLSFDSEESKEDNRDKTETLAYTELNYWNAQQCFFCDSIPDGTIGGCVEHMHKQHGFFLPDAEYLKDLEGFLSYLGLKVTRDFMCLYCEDRGKQFSSVEAVRKHMISKSHCKLQYNDEHREEDLENFYDFTSSYLPEEDAELVSDLEPATSSVSLTTGGAELVIKHGSGRKKGVKTVGCREFLRYYKQKPRPSDIDNGTPGSIVVSRYCRVGLSTKQRQDGLYNCKETKKSPHFLAEAMRTKLGINNNRLNNLPRNVLY